MTPEEAKTIVWEPCDPEWGVCTINGLDSTDHKSCGNEAIFKAKKGAPHGICAKHMDKVARPTQPALSDAAARKAKPLCTGVLDYFPLALEAVAICSRVGNEQHNPGQPLHWAKDKSTDHADALLRHLIDRGTVDTDGVLHSAKVAWRALAMLQTELEKAVE